MIGLPEPQLGVPKLRLGVPKLRLGFVKLRLGVPKPRLRRAHWRLLVSNQAARHAQLPRLVLPMRLN